MKKSILFLSLLPLAPLAQSCKKSPGKPTFGETKTFDGKRTPPETGGGEPGGGGGGTIPEVPMKSEQNYSILDADCSGEEDVRGIRQWRRLSNKELRNTTEALFGNVNGVNYDLVSDYPRHELYDTLMVAPNHINDGRMKAIQAFASTLADKFDLDKVIPCHKEGEACVGKNFRTLAEKAYRRPLLADEQKSFTDLYKALIADKFTSEKAMRFLVEALVQAQPYLYRSELGEKQSGGEYKLTSYEVASALSYGITRTLPDDVLLNLAKDNKLLDAAEIEKQAKRLLALPAAKEAMKEFGGMWLSSQKIMSQIKEDTKWTDPLRKSFANEVEDFFAETFFSSDKKLADILVSKSIPSGTADTWPYGSKADKNRLEYSQEQRLGVLGTVGFLAATEAKGAPSPVQRGVYVLSRFMCVGFEPPPEVPPSERKPGQTNKDRYRIYESGNCGTCHKTMNQYGFVFENFDASGSYITKDAGQDIVTDSEVVIDDEEVSITSPEQLPLAIAKSDQLIECFSRHVFRYGYGRLEKVPERMVGETKKEFVSTQTSEADRCEIQAISKAVKAAKGDMKAGIIEAYTNPGFLLRLNSQGE